MSLYAINGKEPVAAWIPSQDTAGNGTTTLNDLVGSNHGTLTNMDVATDWVLDGGKYALDFVGNNAHIETNYQGITGSSARTCAFWMRSSGSGTIISWGTTAGASAFEVRVQNNAIALAIAGAFIVGTTNVVDDVWHHVAVSYSAAGQLADAKIYVDGSLDSISSQLGPTIILNTGTGSLRIARNIVGNVFYSDLIDDTRIWNVPLDATDVAALYAAGRGGLLNVAAGFTGIRGVNNRLGTSAPAGFTGIRGISRRLGT